ncbi:hypothetical protein ACDA63_06070 [Uliginosibacterium sp. sgz301328]|uniref:hypothetical protein n=1 Tax=Uliginosibacterium sp. sgz301328 TaxID=3243764 RepID=UPI00359DEA1A
MLNDILVKTEAGQQEIQDRKLRLTPRQRTLLVTVDGKQTGTRLLETLAPAGVTEDMLMSLIEQGLVVPGGGVDGGGSPATVATTLAASPTAGHVAVAEPATDSQRLQALYGVFDVTIRAFGMRGFMLQLQLEKAASIDDYRSLAGNVLSVLDKSKGERAVSDFMSQVKPLLGTL